MPHFTAKKHRLPMPLRALAVLLNCALVCASCSYFKKGASPESDSYSSKRAAMEADAATRLTLARQQLTAGACDSARHTIEQMRRDCYLALTARGQAIQLMDSVDIRQARANLSRIDSLLRAGADSVGQADFDEAFRKVEFYERKLQHDQQKR